MDQVPWPLHEAIMHGLHILGWFDNYQEAEIPDENLWDDAQALEQHWKRVRQRREDEREGITVADGDGEPGHGDTMDNAYAAAFKK